MFLLIETETKGGEVRSVARHETLDDAVNAAVEVAKQDGYLDPTMADYPTETELRLVLTIDRKYVDCDVLTTIFELVA